jgi:DNA repair protein RadC
MPIFVGVAKIRFALSVKQKTLMEDFNKSYTPIKNWANDDKPREKLSALGPQSLSKSELLAILINHGTKNRSAVDLARDLLDKCQGNLHKLARFSIEELQQTEGIGPAKAITIKAALELGVRKEMDRLSFEKNILNTASDAVEFLQQRLQDLPIEQFIVIFLNKGNRVLKVETFSTGGLTGTVVDVRVIAKRAIELGATSILVSHNHPSGSLKPSSADKEITKKLKQALQILDIVLVDHIIVSDEGFHSFQENGEL